MKTIWKYLLSYPFEVCMMPEGAKILTVQTQGGCPVIWAEVDPQAEKERRAFRTLPTGHVWDNDAQEDYANAYVGTVQIGALVFHIYETNPWQP